MIRGIGVDMTEIEEIRRFLAAETISGPYVRQTFTKAEQEAAAGLKDPAEYLAARFAAKEAVFKALAPLLPEKTFDLRMVETLNRKDGSPCVNTDGPLSGILRRADVDTLHISITTKGLYAAAFVIAEREASH